MVRDFATRLGRLSAYVGPLERRHHKRRETQNAAQLANA